MSARARELTSDAATSALNTGQRQRRRWADRSVRLTVLRATMRTTGKSWPWKRASFLRSGFFCRTATYERLGVFPTLHNSWRLQQATAHHTRDPSVVPLLL